MPLVGRRNAGVKFYRLILVISGVLILAAALSHAAAGRQVLASIDAVAAALVAFLYFVLRYPKRWIYAIAWSVMALALCVAVVLAYHAAVRPPSYLWTFFGAISATAILGSVNLAMILGHWYLVVRGMPIDPLKRLTLALLISSIARIVVVAVVLALISDAELHRVAVAQGIFFWMRVGWGLVGAVVLWPMIWGTVKIRSTMAATGILYVAVVAVIIGEVLAAYLSALQHLPL